MVFNGICDLFVMVLEFSVMVLFFIYFFKQDCLVVFIVGSGISLLTMPHRFSTGFRSGEFAGQSSTVTSWSLNQLFNFNFNFKLLLSLHRNATKFHRLHTEVPQRLDNMITTYTQTTTRNQIHANNANDASKTTKSSSEIQKLLHSSQASLVQGLNGSWIKTIWKSGCACFNWPVSPSRR